MNMTATRAYDDCLKRMFALRRFGIKLGLETIDSILDGLGHPQQRYRCVHVAGTNGKGSVAAMLAAILANAGYRTGLYTSPHLVRFNERIRVDGAAISDPDVVAAYEAVCQVHPSSREPTFFEFTTAMALYEFGRRNVQWAVIETGMGGRMDATNVVRPEASVITNISLEHREYLGPTIRAIASEKAGIIKPGVPVVTGVNQAEAVAVIRDLAGARNAPVYRLGRDFRVRRKASGGFNYEGVRERWPDLQIPLAGDHQFGNAALALAACEMLGSASGSLTHETIRSGLAKTNWPGRMECVSRRPYILIDGAHNLIAARRLADYLSADLKDRRIVLVVGILSDKPYRAMLRALVPLCARVVVTRPAIDRGLPPETLLAEVKRMTDRVQVIPDVGRAVAQAVETAAPEDAVCIAGSLYVVGEAKEALKRMGYGSPSAGGQ
jgi:dihydrofolate synthase/folylpolyglutamate synthase